MGLRVKICFLILFVYDLKLQNLNSKDATEHIN